MVILFLLQGNLTLYGLGFQLKARQIHLFILKTFFKKKTVSLFLVNFFIDKLFKCLYFNMLAKLETEIVRQCNHCFMYKVFFSWEFWLENLQRNIWGLSGKSPTIVNIKRTVCAYQCNVAAKESGLECTCVNSDDFTVLVTGGHRHHWVSMYMCGCHIQNDWVSRATNLHQILH